MNFRQTFLISIFFAIFVFTFSCRTRNNEFVTIALTQKFSTLNTLTSTASEAAAERIRTLMFNSLVKKNDKFDYVGELAREIKTSEDGKIITFVLQDNVKFHDGRDLTAADVKYTFVELFKSNGVKSNSFYETVDKVKTPHIVSIDIRDAKTVNFTLSRAALKNQLLSNLVAIPIIPEGTIDQQQTQPIGSGAYKFLSFDTSQNIIELEANPNYWDGAPKIQKIRVKTITDASSLQAELQSGGVDIAPLPSNLSPDTIKSLGQNPSLTVKQFNGSNVQYLQFNTESAPFTNPKLRQAVGYAIDREKIINELLFGQAVIAHSILPIESWAYNAGTKYNYDPAKAKQLVQEAGYKNELIKYKFTAGNSAVSQYALVVQNSLKDAGLNVEIETLEFSTLSQQLALGQYQMNSNVWIGGNQDPIFLRDLFASSKIPTEKGGGFNRSRYDNPEADKILGEAANATDREQARELYFKAQEIVSRDLPMFPLWYPANMVVANKRIGNININASGDWSFVKDLTLEGK